MGKYQLVRRLATGGMAEVFLAKAAGPMGFEKELVVKRILPHLAEDPQFVEMFLTEAKLAARLNHANVVQIFDFGEQDESFFIAMEYVEGLNLRVLSQRALRRGTPLPYPLCARIVSLACEGLAYAHELVDGQSGQPLGLIHRDVSTDNILVSLTGGVKVVDFGIAKAANQGQQTRSGTLKGKLAYMAPEYLLGRPIDLRADVYALGVVLYELVAGHKPFQAEGDAQLVQLILHERPADVRARHPEVPDALFRIIDRALTKDRDARYVDCRQLQADLERLIYHCGEPVGTQQISEWVRTMAAAQTGEFPSRRPSQERLATAVTPPPAPNPQTDPSMRPEPPPPLTGTTFVIYPKPLAQEAEAEQEATGVLPKRPEEPTRMAPVSPLLEAPTQRVPVLSRVPTAAMTPAVADDEEVLRRAVGQRTRRVVSALLAVAALLSVAGYVVWGQMNHPPATQPPLVAAAAPREAVVTEPTESVPAVQEPTQESAAGSTTATPPPSAVDEPTTPTVVKESAPAEKLAVLVVDSNLPGQIRLNGKIVGQTPLARSVEPGRLRVEVFGTAQGEQFDKAQLLKLRPGERKEVSFNIQRVSVQVRGRPDDMKALSLDGKKVDGEGRVVTYEGKHRLQLLHTPTGKFYQTTCEARPGEKLCKFVVKEAL